MKASYINALEMRAKWLRFAKEYAGRKTRVGEVYGKILLTYAHCLETGNSYYINKNFCALVDHARLTIPDDIAFEEQWMLSDSGFVWLETPFRVPTPINSAPASPEELEAIRGEIAAIGWIKVTSQSTGEPGYYFMTFRDYGDLGADAFGCWSHVVLKSGDKMIDKIRYFEANHRDPNTGDGNYFQDRNMETLHEFRWIYSALHLMSQKLTHVHEEKTSGMARHDAARKRLQIAPIIKVVSLRRMEADRPKGGSDEHQHRDWRWQWIVQGHWRLQPYKTLDDYRWIFIESYVKGPESKPLKVPQHIIYKAQR